MIYIPGAFTIRKYINPTTSMQFPCFIRETEAPQASRKSCEDVLSKYRQDLTKPQRLHLIWESYICVNMKVAKRFATFRASTT